MTEDTTPPTDADSVAAEAADTAAAAARLLAKLRTFVAEQLDPEEQTLLEVLLAPGVSLAYPDDEVVGFGVGWRAEALPEALATTLRDAGVRV